MDKKKDVSNLGQVFTPKDVVDKMIGLMKNRGRILEPSCGDGAFSDALPGCTAVEIDARHAPPYAINCDFFDFAPGQKFDTIIGNPPYVKYRDIPESTRHKMPHALCDGRSGLHLHFIEKCIGHLSDGGELILIIPRDFIKATGSVRLNTFLHENGTITDFFDLGDKKIFDGATPNCAIFRWEKGNMSHTMSNGESVFCENGFFRFGGDALSVPLSSIAYVKVGGVSGADEIFASTNGNAEFVCSTTRDDKSTRRYFHSKDVPHEALLPHKDALMQRRIRKFNEGNWWRWGREPFVSDDPRVYVNGKTRRKTPFFVHEGKLFDGSVLGIFPKDKNIDIAKLAEALNAVPWEEMGFVCDGRFLFSQKSLENAPIPLHLLLEHGLQPPAD